MAQEVGLSRATNVTVVLIDKIAIGIILWSFYYHVLNVKEIVTGETPNTADAAWNVLGRSHLVKLGLVCPQAH